MNIDFTQMITADHKADQAHEQRVTQAKLECGRRIEAVADEVAQRNIIAANGAGLLTVEQAEVWRNALLWVTAMRQAWRAIVDDDRDPSDDVNWPEVPPGVAELAAQF